MPRIALLDANILLRLTKSGLDHLNPAVANVVADVVNEGLQLRCLAAQVRETYAILTRSREGGGGGHEPQEAIIILHEIIALVPLLEEKTEWSETWMRLVVEHEITKVRTHDAYLAAAAIATGSLLVTSDHGFKRFGELDLRLI